jgi:hypothetical protein
MRGARDALLVFSMAGLTAITIVLAVLPRLG